MGVEDDYLHELERRRDSYLQKLEETLDEIERRRRALDEAGELSPEERHRRIRSGFWAVPPVVAAVAWVVDHRSQAITAAVVAEIGRAHV